MFYCPNCNNTFDITKLSAQAIEALQQANTNQHGGYFTDSFTDSSLESSANGNTSVKQMINSLMQQGGGNIENIIESILKKTIKDEDIKGVSIDDITNNQSYKKLNKKEKERVYNKIQDMLPIDKKRTSQVKKNEEVDKAYFICNNCKFTKKIEPRTMIFSKSSKIVSQTYIASDYSSMINSKILPITREYICPNDKCESHKDPVKKEAIFFRMNNTFKLKYICKTCKTQF